MNEIIYEIIKLAVMVSVLVFTRYMIPWIKDKIGMEKLAVIEKWVKYAVQATQQVHWDIPGKDRKAIVTDFLKKILQAKNISISDEQLNILIEAAVKQMKINEKSGIVIEAVDTEEPAHRKEQL